MHPHCHCSTAPHVDRKKALEKAKRIRNGDRGESNILYRKGGKGKQSSKLTIPMRLGAVKGILNKYDIDLEGNKLKIIKQNDLIGRGYYGGVDIVKPNLKYLYPDAFKDEETLIKTVLHERELTKQYSKYSINEIINNPYKFELKAVKTEEI